MLTAEGIAIGAPRHPTGFTIVRLFRDDARSDWQAPAACITVGGAVAACGTVLIDTGIEAMFLTVPEDRLAHVRQSDEPSRLIPGTHIAIDLTPGQVNGADAGYSFILGDDHDGVAPAGITLAGIGRRPTFVNTGVHLLNRYDYLFDAEQGLVGFRRRG